MTNAVTNGNGKSHSDKLRIFETNNKTFIAREHAPVQCEVTGLMMVVTIDVVTKSGLREIGAATCLMEAHSLARKVRVKYTAPESKEEIAKMICDDTRNDTYRSPRGARRRSN